MIDRSEVLLIKINWVEINEKWNEIVDRDEINEEWNVN